MALSTSRFSILIAEAFRSLIERVQRDGTCWCGPTEWQGRAAMRICVSSWATPDEDVDRGVAAIVRAARDYRPTHKNGVATRP
jgi:hypothetical protein